MEAARARDALRRRGGASDRIVRGERRGSDRRLVSLISGEGSADVEDATRRLVEFDKHAQRTLGTDNPALGPMTAILLRTESASGSQIEQLTTSAKQLALAEIDEGDKANALAVVGNVRAMEAALQLAGPRTVEFVAPHHERIHGAIADLVRFVKRQDFPVLVQER